VLVSTVALCRNPFIPSPFPPLPHVPSASFRLSRIHVVEKEPPIGD
jgi:hypothetical protein